MQDPLASVHMITYNHEPYIRKAIDCVLAQKTNFPFELVIGEDCSTDGTREIVFDYAKRYPEIIRVITSNQNVGMHKNSRRTSLACRGKYVAYCEGDDYWHHPVKLQKQVDYLEGHPQCGLVFADCDIYYDQSREFIKSFNYCQGGYRVSRNLTVEETLAGGLLRFTCTAVLRRSLAEQIIESDSYLYQSEVFLMGDTQLWTELAILSEVSYIAETMATYRVLEGSASRNKDPKKFYRFWKSAYEMMIYLCDKHHLSENLRKEKELAWCDVCLKLAYHERDAHLAKEVLLKKKTFSWKEWIRYFGAINIAAHYICRTGASFQAFFRK